jgi:hypothetical protein
MSFINQLLSFVPAGTSLILGVVYLFAGDATPSVRGAGTTIFLVALYLQFFSRFALAGLLMQTALALSLAVWSRVNASR